MAKAELKCRLREETWEHVLQISSETINCCQKMRVFAICFVRLTLQWRLLQIVIKVFGSQTTHEGRQCHRLPICFFLLICQIQITVRRASLSSRRYRLNIRCLCVLLLTGSRPGLFLAMVSLCIAIVSYRYIEFTFTLTSCIKFVLPANLTCATNQKCNRRQYAKVKVGGSAIEDDMFKTSKTIFIMACLCTCTNHRQNGSNI